jgi:hypothetical protein
MEQNSEKNEDQETVEKSNETQEVSVEEESCQETELSKFVEIGENEVEVTNSLLRPKSDDRLIPTFVMSAPRLVQVLPKGLSKPNLAKGKRPALVTTPHLLTVDGDLQSGLETSRCNTMMKQLYKAARVSQDLDHLERTRNTMVARIQEMHDKNMLLLVDVFKMFQKHLLPISMSLPGRLPRELIANFLQLDIQSAFVDTINDSPNLQETMRKTFLETKHLHVCPCGYIYVHPIVTMVLFGKNPNFVVGKLPGGDSNVASFPKSTALEHLNALRFFLEICYENLNSM